MYVIRESRVAVNCSGRYCSLAVMDMEPDAPPPRMISLRASGCRAIIRQWERLYMGTTEKCVYRRALAKATELVAGLNSGAIKPNRLPEDEMAWKPARVPPGAIYGAESITSIITTINHKGESHVSTVVLTPRIPAPDRAGGEPGPAYRVP